MSSELLLRGRGICKAYGSPLHPWQRLKSAILGEAPDAESLKVLDNIDIDVCRGETVGIMGRNGAGKSTLLGILGNVIPANSGTVENHGKIAVLLELGAGFNPNITGEENARIYCRMMGMDNREIEKKVPQIEAFAELGEYFHYPIRTYSSGMYSRLGFAAAVHVDADLIIVDETLSVGDASFKMKCYAQIERMKDAGMSFLLVSHNQNLVANFCTRAVVIEGQKKKFDGEPLEAVGVYKQIRTEFDKQSRPKVIATRNRSINDHGDERVSMEGFSYREELEEDVRIGVVSAELSAYEDISHPAISLGLRNSSGIAICSVSTATAYSQIPPLSAGDTYNFEFRFLNVLIPGPYFVTVHVSEYLVGDVKHVMWTRENALRFDVVREKRGSGVVDLDMNVNWVKTDNANNS